MSRTRLLAATAGLLFIAPLLVLPVQAFADEWRAPALWPQKIGNRGFSRLLDDNVLPTAIANSAIVGLTAAIVGLAIAWPAARSVAAAERPKALTVVLLAPLLLPPLVVGEGLQVWFLRLGLADRLLSVALAHLVYVIPYCILLLVPGFTTALFEQEQAAQGLGASAGWRWRLVTFPAVRPHLALAAAMGFTVSWSQYGTSLGVGGGIPMLPLVLVPFVGSDPQIAAALDLVFLLPPLVVLIAAVRAPRTE